MSIIPPGPLMRGRYNTSSVERALRHGTTTVGIRTTDYVILAADRRATTGYYVAHKKARKIVRITRYAAMTISGLVADAQILAEWLQVQSHYHRLVSGRDMPISAMATILSNILNSSKFFPFIVHLIIGGYDNSPKLYTLDWFGTVTEEKFIATGSGSPVALGLLEDSYDENLPLEKGIELAKRAVMSAIRRDSFTGNGVDVLVFLKDRTLEYHYEINGG